MLISLEKTLQRFHRPSAILQNLNKLPSDMAHTCFKVLQGIDATNMMEKENMFSILFTFVCVSRDENAGSPFNTQSTHNILTPHTPYIQ